MSTHATTVYAYWSGRREGFQRCATRMDGMLNRLATIHPTFQGWVQEDPVTEEWASYGGSPRTIDGLVRRLQIDWDDTEMDRTKLPGAGMSTSAWNREEGSRGAFFRASVEDLKKPVDTNNISLHLRSRMAGDPSLICTATLTKVLAEMVAAWDAAWATVFPFDLWEAMEIPVGPLRTGWITYLSAPLAHDFVVPAGFAVEPGPGGGLIIQTTEAVLEPQNPEHLTKAKALQAALDLIQPLARR